MNWQPIETAPKDGAEVLLWARDGNCGEDGFFIARWSQRDKRFESDLCAEFHEPTHWALLTPPEPTDDK
jgi:hypothetical protein